jgi:hypothetical protein
MQDRALYSMQKARKLLRGISRMTIYHLLRMGKLASLPIGSRRFISAEASLACGNASEAARPAGPHSSLANLSSHPNFRAQGELEIETDEAQRVHKDEQRVLVKDWHLELLFRPVPEAKLEWNTDPPGQAGLQHRAIDACADSAAQGSGRGQGLCPGEVRRHLPGPYDLFSSMVTPNCAAYRRSPCNTASCFSMLAGDDICFAV